MLGDPPMVAQATIGLEALPLDTPDPPITGRFSFTLLFPVVFHYLFTPTNPSLTQSQTWKHSQTKISADIMK